MRGFLQGIAGPASRGNYNVRYGGAGGPQTFTDYSAHPNTHAPIPGTKPTSSAARVYQMIQTDLGRGGR
jgi:muramidase (phage lysozyme)